MFLLKATTVEIRLCLIYVLHVRSSSSLPYSSDLSPHPSLCHCSAGQSLCANTETDTSQQLRENTTRHRWAWTCVLPSRLLSYYSSSMVQGSGIVPSMRLLMVISGPNTPEMSLQTAMLGDVWSCSERGSIAVPLINSRSCHFLVWGPCYTACSQ